MPMVIRLSQVLASAALTAAALWATIREAPVFTAFPAEIFRNSNGSAGLDVVVPLSIHGQRDWLMNCDDSLVPMKISLLSAGQRQAVINVCRAGALSVLARGASDALAYLVLSSTETQSGRFDMAAAFLLKSMELAPNEGWLAERRFVLIANHTELAHLLPEASAALVRSQSGAELAADYYHRRPDLKPVFTAMLPQLDAKDAQRLSNRIIIQRPDGL